MTHESPERGNPEELFSLAADVQRGFDEAEKLPSRLERYGFAKARAVATLGNIRGIVNRSEEEETGYTLQQLEKLAATVPKLTGCGEYLHFRNYYTVGKLRLHTANFCKVHLLCPLCAIRRGAKTLKAYLDRYRAIIAQRGEMRLSMLTFTVKDGPDLAERFEHLKKSIERCVDRRRWSKSGNGRRVVTEWTKILGAVGTYEIKRGANSGEWHPHVHMMVLHRERFDWQALKDEWLKITGDSHVVNCTPAKHPDQPELDFLEICKYAVKFSDMGKDDLIEAYLILSGRRMLFSLGEFRGVKVPEALEDEPLEDLPYVDLFYGFFQGVYNLVATCKQGEQPYFVDPDSNHAMVAFHAILATDTGTKPILEHVPYSYQEILKKPAKGFTFSPDVIFEVRKIKAEMIERLNALDVPSKSFKRLYETGQIKGRTEY
jgi:hypothetical protein